MVLERSALLPISFRSLLMGCRPLLMGCRAPPDVVMASMVELMKRSALVMKTQTSMRMHLVLP